MWKTNGTTCSRSSYSIEIEEIVTVVGHGAEKVQEQLGNVSEFALQAEQLGTAHAVIKLISVLANKKEQLLLFVVIHL